MVVGQRVAWLGSSTAKQGRVSAVNVEARTVDVVFFDSSTRGALPIVEIVSEAEDAPIYMPAEDVVADTLFPPSIESREEIGGLG